MKSGIHPEYMATKVKCNGCGTAFETHSTVPEITVEICSNCHPFYTGKQKLVDTAGRVDKFKARQAAAAKLQKTAKPTEPVIDQIEEELEDKTVDLPPSEARSSKLESSQSEQ
jgi:large subunit ribosomal protein L31